jgi:hypothetical protein
MACDVNATYFLRAPKPKIRNKMPTWPQLYDSVGRQGWLSVRIPSILYP